MCCRDVGECCDEFWAAGTVDCCGLVPLLWSEVGGPAWVRVVSKPLASLGFIGVGLACGALDNAVGQATLVALFLCAVGDVCLLGTARAPFLAGLVAFLLGHVGYAAACLLGGVSAAAVGLAALPLVLFGGGVLRWLWPSLPAKMKVPVCAYVAVIMTMAACAVGATAAGRSVWIAVGAGLFVVSDLFVARNRFVAPGPVNRLWGLPLYYGAQLILAAVLGSDG